MFKTAYDTLPCSMYKMDEIYKGISLAIAGNDRAITPAILPQFSSGQQHQDVTVSSMFLIDGAVNIPLFAHPILIDSSANSKVLIYTAVSDARDVTKRDFDNGWKVTAQSEFNFIRARLIMQSRWFSNILSGAKSAPAQNFPMRVFSRWLADALARRFNLDLDAAIRVQALAAFMYISMHNSDKELKDYEIIDISMKISRGVNIPSGVVAETLADIHYLDNVSDFCDALITRVVNSRLEGLNPVVLYGIIKGSWFGKNASELVSVAIEHPPTFDALIHAAAGSSTLQRTILGTLVKGELRDREALAFVESVNRLILDKE